MKEQHLMNQIVAVDNGWAIGKDGDLLVSIPEDMKFFRSMTKGRCVIMGRKTLDSFPGGRPLKGRRNIVLTKRPDADLKGAERASSVEEALELVKDEEPENVFVIGGSSIYKAFLPYCDTCYVTRIERDFSADTWYPDLDRDEAWQVIDESEVKEYEGIPYRFVTYSKKG